MPLWTDKLQACSHRASRVTALCLGKFLWPLWHAFPQPHPQRGPISQPWSSTRNRPGGGGTAVKGRTWKAPRILQGSRNPFTEWTRGHVHQAQGQREKRETKCKLSEWPHCRATDLCNKARSFVCFLAFGNRTTDTFTEPGNRCPWYKRAESPTANTSSPTVSSSWKYVF